MDAETWAQSEAADSFLDDAIGAVRSIELAARVLRIAAIVSAAIWLFGTIATAWFIWDQTERFSQSVPQGGVLASGLGEDTWQRVAQTASSTVSATWGYALVAIVALAGWLYAESRRASVFLDALDEVEELRPSAPPDLPGTEPRQPT
jgi:hypothetical protein